MKRIISNLSIPLTALIIVICLLSIQKTPYPTPVQAQTTNLAPIFNSNPTASNPLLVHENFETVEFKGMSSNNWWDYGHTGSSSRIWRNTGNNNLQIVSSINDSGRTVSVREGQKAIRWIVDPNDVGPRAGSYYQSEWRRRSEFVNIHSGTRTADHGTEYWYGVSIYIPSDYGDDTVGEIIFQFHDSGRLGMNPPIALYTDEGRFGMWIYGDDRPSITSSDNGNFKRMNRYDLGPVIKGQWTDWVFNIKWSYNMTTNPNDPNVGFARVWKNGEIAHSPNILYGANDYVNPQGPYVKFGIYKSLWALPEYRQRSQNEGVTKRILYHDALRISQRLPGEAALSMAGFERVSPGDASSPPPAIPDNSQTTCTRTINSGQNIQPALNQANPGDVICIAPGTYHEELDLERSGTASQPITIRAQDPNNRPVIDGRAGVECGDGNCGLPNGATGRCSAGNKCFRWDALFRINASHIIIDGLELTRSMGATMYVGQHDKPINNFTIRNAHLHNARHRNLVFTNTSNIKVHDNLLHHSGMFAPYVRGTELNWGANFSIIRTDTADVRRNIIHSTWGEGIIFDGQDYNSSNITVEDNVFYDTWRGSINVHGAKNAKVNRNFVYISNTANGRDFGNNGNSLHAIVVRSTEPQDNFAEIRSNNVQVTNNIIISRKHGISINEVDGLLIANNTIINSEEAAMRQTNPTATNVRIFNNILEHNPAFEPFQGPAQNITFRNNHWTSTPKADAQGPGDIYGQIILQNPNIALPAPQTPSLSQMRALAENFRLTSNSPDVNAGTNVSEVSTDYFLGTRPIGGNSDIGAHEFGSTPEDPGGLGSPTGNTTPTPGSNGPVPSITPTPTFTVPEGSRSCAAECVRTGSSTGICSNSCADLLDARPILDAALCQDAPQPTCCCFNYPTPTIRAAQVNTPIPVQPTLPPPPTQEISFISTPRLCELTTIVKDILKLVLALAGIASFIMALAAGYLWLTAGGNDQQLKTAQSTMTWSIIGIALFLGSFFILLLIEQFTGINVTTFSIPWIGNTASQPTVCQ